MGDLPLVRLSSGYAVQVSAPIRGWLTAAGDVSPSLSQAQVFPQLPQAAAAYVFSRLLGHQAEVRELVEWRGLRLYQAVPAGAARSYCTAAAPVRDPAQGGSQ